VFSTLESFLTQLLRLSELGIRKLLLEVLSVELVLKVLVAHLILVQKVLKLFAQLCIFLNLLLAFLLLVRNLALYILNGVVEPVAQLLALLCLLLRRLFGLIQHIPILLLQLFA
jgi:hypothetical protein